MLEDGSKSIISFLMDKSESMLGSIFVSVGAVAAATTGISSNFCSGAIMTPVPPPTNIISSMDGLFIE